MMFPTAITEGAAVDAAFLEQLIKRSLAAEEILQDCGRIRFQRAIQAAVELYRETCPPVDKQAGERR